MEANIPRRIMVFRTGHLGDTICAIPAFRLIRNFFAGAEVILLCDRPHGLKVAVTEVVGKLGIFENVATYDSNRGLLTVFDISRVVRNIRPDLVIILPQVRNSAENVRWKRQFFRHCGVTDVRGHNFPVLRHAWQPNEADRLVQMLHSIGVRGAKPGYAIPVDVASRESVRAKLRAVGVDAGQPFLIFCGGGKHATQHWPMERYAAIFPALNAEMKWPIVGLGTPPEVENYRRLILPQFPDLRLPAGLFSIPEIFELCRLGAAWFGNDTGPMHLAGSVGCPVAAVISARNSAGSWDPDVEPRIVIRHRTECEDCFLTECVREQHRCLKDITVERVYAELVPFLKGLKATARAEGGNWKI